MVPTGTVKILGLYSPSRIQTSLGPGVGAGARAGAGEVWVGPATGSGVSGAGVGVATGVSVTGAIIAGASAVGATGLVQEPTTNNTPIIRTAIARVLAFWQLLPILNYSILSSRSSSIKAVLTIRAAVYSTITLATISAWGLQLYS